MRADRLHRTSCPRSRKRKLPRTLRICAVIFICAPRVLLASPPSVEKHDDENARLPSDSCQSGGSLQNKRMQSSQHDEYLPPEWNSLDDETKAKLARLLSYENLSTWGDFNVVEVAALTPDPLLLVGWAILCEPMAQKAMKRNLEIVCDEGESTASKYAGTYHYHFGKNLKINVRAIINFLREIERRYIRANPYHNNIHAADVTQTLHCLYQMFGDYLPGIYDAVSIFSSLLAATFHDVAHPGTTNLFQLNAKTQIAIEYDHESLLENMHSAIGHSLLFGEERRDEWDVFEGWTSEKKLHAGEIMRKVILATDMSHHVAISSQLDSLIIQVQQFASTAYVDDIDAEVGEKNNPRSIPVILARTIDIGESHGCNKPRDQAQRYNDAQLEIHSNQLADLMLGFFLHAADISNSAKKEDLAIYWSSRVLSEFYLQGDKEKKMGLPVSPLCDRDTVNKEESQVNFIKFVTQPTFELLGRMIPRVNEEVRPNVDNTLAYWEQEQQKLQTADLIETSYWESLKDTLFGFEMFVEESIFGFEVSAEEIPYLVNIRERIKDSSYPYWERLRKRQRFERSQESSYWDRLRARLYGPT